MPFLECFLVIRRTKDIISDFLQAVVGLSGGDVSGIEILNLFLRLKDVNNELGILDINLTAKSGKIIDIEMQVKKVASMRQRCCTSCTGKPSRES